MSGAAAQHGEDVQRKAFDDDQLAACGGEARTYAAPPALVPLELREGQNQILLKIQNGSQAWAFAARFPDSQVLAEALWDSAAAGDVDRTEKILSLTGGLDVDAATRYGLTAWQIATIFGRTDVAELLAARGAEVARPRPAPETLVTNMLSTRTAGRTPGVAVLVEKDGKVLYSHGFGFASLEHSVPVTPRTKFRIGSITLRAFRELGVSPWY